MEKDKHAILEKNLNSLESRITDDIRLLIRKLNSEWLKVEKYKEAIVIRKEGKKSFKRQILHINEDKINLSKQLKGSEDRRDSVKKSQEEFKKCLSGLRKEEEKVGKAYDIETEALRKKIELYQRKWQERYELRYAKKPFVQEHEKAKRSLAESKEELKCSKSNLRDCQADIFKAKCERGKRNAEESGFYPLQSFIIRISRVGVGIGKVETEENEILKDILYLQNNLDNVIQIRASKENLDAREKENTGDECMTEHTSVNPTSESNSEIFNGNQEHRQKTNAQLRHNIIHEPQLPNHRAQLHHELNFPAQGSVQLKPTAQWLPQSYAAAQNSTKAYQIISEGKVRNRMERLKLYTPKFSPSPDETPLRNVNFTPSRSITFRGPTAIDPSDGHHFSRLREKRFTEISVNNSSTSTTIAKQCSKIPKLTDNARYNVVDNRKDELQMQNTKEFGAIPKSFSPATKYSVTTLHESSENTVSLRQGIPPLITIQKDSIKMNKNNTLLCKSRVLHDEISRTIRYKNAQNNESEMNEKCIQGNILSENTERAHPQTPYTNNANLQTISVKSCQFPHHVKENSAIASAVTNSDAKRVYVDIDYAAECWSYKNDQKMKKVRISNDNQEASMNGRDFAVSDGNIGHGTVQMTAEISNERSSNANTSFSESSSENKYLTPNKRLYKDQVLKVKSFEYRMCDSNVEVHQKATKILKHIEKEPQKTLCNVPDGLLTLSTDQVPQRSKDTTTLDKDCQELNIPHEKCGSINKTHQETMLAEMENTQREPLDRVDTICSNPLNTTAIKAYEEQNTIVDKFILDERNMDHKMNKASEPLRKDNVAYKINADTFNQELSDATVGKDYQDKRDINRAMYRSSYKVDQVLPVQKESLRADNASGDSWKRNVDEVHETSMDMGADKAFTVDENQENHMNKSQGNNESLENFYLEALSTYVRNSQKEPPREGASDVTAKRRTYKVFQEQNDISIHKDQEMRNVVVDKEHDESGHVNVETNRQETKFMNESTDAFRSELLVTNESKVHSQTSVRAMDESFGAIQSMEGDTVLLGRSKGETQEQPIRDGSVPQELEDLSVRNCNSDPQKFQKQLIEEMRIQNCKINTSDGYQSDSNNSTSLELTNGKIIATVSPNNYNTSSGETALYVSDVIISPAFEKGIKVDSEKPLQGGNSSGAIVSETKSCQLQAQTQDLTCENNSNKSDIYDKEKPKSAANESPVQSILITSQNNYKSSSSGGRYFSSQSNGEFTQDKMSGNCADSFQQQASDVQDYRKNIESSSPFDFEKHMEVLGKMKQSPHFTYKTRHMYEPSATSKAPPEITEVGKDVSFDSMSFLNNPSSAASVNNLRESEKSRLEESEFLSFAYEDYLADSPVSDGGKEKSMFSFGCDSPKSSAQSPPFFPMFAAVDSQENDHDNAKSDFIFSFGGAEKSKSPEKPSVFKFAF